MYNKSRLTVRVKRFKSKMVQTSLMHPHYLLVDIYAVSILNVYEAALTYKISVNHINDNVQHSEITFDHICVHLKKHAQISVDCRGMYFMQQ